jgi:hypothetical protein
VSGVAGGAAGQWGGKYLGDVIINGTKITSPVLQGAVSGAAGGAAGGYAGGFTAGLIMTGDFVEANSAGWKGAAFGAPIGGISGAASAYKYANDKGINPWTGKEKKQSSISQQNTLPYTDQQMGHKFGEHRDANLEGYRTISEYRQLANDIYNDPISIKTTFPLNSPMYGGETHYYWNGNLLRLDANGYFRSLYPH